MADRPKRNVAAQRFLSFALAVQIAPTPMSQAAQQATLQALYTTFVISVPIGGTPVFWGDSSISAALGNGIQVSPGVPQVFSIGDQRQLYEVQAPLTRDFFCDAVGIPFTAWDPSTIYLAAAAPQTVGIVLLQENFL